MLQSEATLLQEFTLSIPDRRILHRIGYKSRTAQINPAVSEMLGEKRHEMEALLRPAAVFRILDHAETNQHPIFEGAVKVALCICTIGPELERTSAELIACNEILKGFVLDGFGSEAAEEVAIQADAAIVSAAREMELWPSKRFSPGYGAWKLQEQKYVFAALPSDKIGVELSETCMMIPRKSVSFRINFYRDKESTTRSFR
jgi:hypothetical protein